MRIPDFWSGRKATDPDCPPEPSPTSRIGETLRQSQFLNDVQQTMPTINRVNARRLFIMFLVFLAFLAVVAGITYLVLPTDQAEFEDLFNRFGYTGVFIAYLLCSMGVFISIPPAFALAVGVTAASTGNLFWVVVIATAGTTLGELTAYYVGYGGRRFLNLQETSKYEIVERWMQRYGGLGITFFAFVPFFMFDFVGIVSGALRYPLPKFLLFCALGRIPRQFIEIVVGTALLELILEQIPL